MAKPRRGGAVTGGTTNQPRALIHKKILEAAADRPDATMDEIADEVVGASTDLVDRVLEEYGDPAGEGDPTADPVEDDASEATETATDRGAEATSAPSGSGDDRTHETSGVSGADPSPSSADESGTEASDGESPEMGGDVTTESTADGVGGEREAPPADGEDEDGQLPEQTGAESATPPEQAVEAGTTASDEPTALGAVGTERDGGSETSTTGPNEEPVGRSGTAGARAVGPPEPTRLPDATELTEKELAVLEKIAERPAATQEALAEELGVSRATISKRANGIDGFEWRHRERFVQAVLGTGAGTAPRAASDGGTGRPTEIGEESGQSTGEEDEDGLPEGEPRTDPSDGSPAVPLDEAADQLSADDGGQAATATGLGLDDPQLVHKVLRTCMEADRITEDEELRLVEAMIGQSD